MSQPPKRIWISNASLPQSLEDGVGEYFPNFPGDGGQFDLLEYVPKAEIAKVWEQAIDIAKDYAKMTVDGFREKYDIQGRFGWVELVAALEAALTDDKGNSNE